MREFTTAEIRRWHTELRQGNEDWYDLAGELLDRLEPLEKIYNAVNLMMNELGAAGGIDTMHDTVSDVMDALHDFDGGVYTRIDLEDK